jgi:hypothetical protein
MDSVHAFLLNISVKQPSLYILLREIPENTSTRKLYGEGDHQQLTTLAHTLACDPRWKSDQSAAFIIRTQPSLMLGVLGHFDTAQRASIEALQGQMVQNVRNLRYVDYRQAEQDCEQLSARLVEAIGKEELRRFCFVGIPRGGLIVLGMLAYILNLSQSQLTLHSDAPLIVVDDCSISGARFCQFLKTSQNDRVIFAPLYAHSSLLQAIKVREPRVEACINAHDLQDYAPTYHQDDYELWSARWHQRAGDSVYWIGIPEHVCFAWNEPDTSIWNPVTEQEEPGWRIVPDEFCLKNRSWNRQPLASIQYQPIAQGSLQPAPGVLFGNLDELVIVANIDTGAILSLSDVAADMWRAIITTPDLNAATHELLQLYDIDEVTLRADLQEFAAAMREQGLLGV